MIKLKFSKIFLGLVFIILGIYLMKTHKRDNQDISNYMPQKYNISIIAKNGLLFYATKTSWNHETFLNIENHKDKFEKNQLRFLKDYLEGENLKMIKPQVVYDQDKSSTVISCTIKNEQLSENDYNFKWFFKNLKISFDDFKKINNTLSYTGLINNIPTDIQIVIANKI